jgi:DHA1 family tetracycline resistance protein-like MFS transporter
VFALFIGTRAPMHAPGAPFLLAGALLLTALAVAWRFARPAQPVTDGAASEALQASEP